MERPRLAVGSGAVPVVEPVGDVARLLDLGDDKPRADGMHGPCRNEDAVPGLRLDDMEDLLAAAFTEGGRERFTIDSGLEARPEPASRRRVDHIPSFGLPLVGRIEPRGTVVVGVDLDGEIAASVEELEQERE